MNADVAHQFALMLMAGLPVKDIMVYFFPESTDTERQSIAAGWVRSKALQQAVKALQGADWHEMSLEKRIQLAVDKHYSELAYFLYSNNYNTVSGTEKTKADTARAVLETKLAGLAGQANPLAQFWKDLKDKKVSLGPVPTTLPA